jgi:hypothetical protein
VTYYWQARAQDGEGRSLWSATQKLVVAFHLIRILSPDRLSCAVGSLMTVELKLTRDAKVTAAFKTDGRFDYVRSFGVVEAGRRTLRLRVPYTLKRPAVYWVRWRAERPNRAENDWLRAEVRPLRSGEVDPPPCKAA